MKQLTAAEMGEALDAIREHLCDAMDHGPFALRSQEEWIVAFDQLRAEHAEMREALENVRDAARRDDGEPDDLRVVAAAILLHGVVHSLPRPYRHNHVIWYMASLGYDAPIDGEQGFLLSDGRFCRRAPAMRIARRAGQLIPRADGYAKVEISQRRELYSEDVW